jgi:hypothetical protein
MEPTSAVISYTPSRNQVADVTNRGNTPEYGPIAKISTIPTQLKTYFLVVMGEGKPNRKFW